ncbi:hypothetical protein [Dysgonomonas termitidis]|uniref:Uncharacterized protein n=1 Tax=Dysgonomonas termitidis TaxID=1516126 RepID=A0ABV9L1B1_9BACT
MKRFITTKFFCTLQEASRKDIDIDTRTLESSYNEFAGLLFTQSTASTDKTVYRNTLAYTRAEFAGLTGVSGKNVRTYLYKAIKLVDIHIEWVERQLLAEPKLFYTQIDTPWKKVSPMTGSSAFDWQISDNDLIELARSLYVANISFHKGKRTRFIDIEK